MNIESLKYFKHIVISKNFTKTAKHFYISQSSLSRHIMSLEEELKTTLFLRNNRILSLTPAGQALFDNIDLLIAHIEEVQKKVRHAGDGTYGSLKIISIGHIDHLIKKNLSDFRTQYPKTDITFEYFDFDHMEEAIRYNLFDVAFTFNFMLKDEEMNELDSIIFAKDTFYILCPSHISSREKFLEQIKNLKFVLPNSVNPKIIGSFINYIEQEFSFDARQIVYLNTTQSVVMQVKCGLGYTIIPKLVVEQSFNLTDTNTLPLSDFIEENCDCDLVLLHKKDNKNNSLDNFLSMFQ